MHCIVNYVNLFNIAIVIKPTYVKKIEMASYISC